MGKRKRQREAEARAVSTNVLRATDGRDVLLNSPDGWEVEQPWLWWTGNGTIGNPIPGAGSPGTWSSIPAVSRATSLIVDTLAAMPWKVYRGTDELETPNWISDPQALRLDGRVIDSGMPPSRLSVMDVRAQWITSALWYGDGYLYTPQRDAEGAPRPPLWVLHPHDVRIEGRRYFVEDAEIPGEQLIHLRGLPPIVGGHGTGVLDRFAAEFGYTQTLKDYAAGVFHSGVPTGYLKSLNPQMDATKAEELKRKWMEPLAGGNGRRSIAVLNATTEFHALTWSPVDAGLVEAMSSNLNDIANAFGVPAYMIGAPTDANTYANIESRRMDLAMFTLLPWSSRIEATLDAQLPRGTSLKVNMDALLRADTATRYAAHGIAIDKGFRTIEEVRELEDLPPLPDEVAGSQPPAQPPATLEVVA